MPDVRARQHGSSRARGGSAWHSEAGHLLKSADALVASPSVPGSARVCDVRNVRSVRSVWRKSSNAPEGGGQVRAAAWCRRGEHAGNVRRWGSQARDCTYNGVRYEPGQTFGDCNECECDGESGIACNPIVCDPGAGGVSSSAGGGTGASANSPGTAGVAGVGGASGAGATAAAGAGGRANQCTYAEVGSLCVLSASLPGRPAGRRYAAHGLDESGRLLLVELHRAS